MGGCCNSSSSSGGCMNLSRSKTVYVEGLGHIDVKTIACVIKCQARFRGLITRRKIRQKYGFQFSGMSKFNNITHLSPQELANQRQHIQEIIHGLPAFKYERNSKSA